LLLGRDMSVDVFLISFKKLLINWFQKFS
jgi:hypothetical protein